MQTISGKPYWGATPDPAEATREAMAVVKAGRLPLVEVFYSLQGEGTADGAGDGFCALCRVQPRLRLLRHGFSRSGDVHRRRACLGRDRAGRRRLPLGLFYRRRADPARLAALCDALHARGYRLQMETNGTRPRPGVGDGPHHRLAQAAAGRAAASLVRRQRDASSSTSWTTRPIWRARWTARGRMGGRLSCSRTR